MSCCNIILCTGIGPGREQDPKQSSKKNAHRIGTAACRKQRICKQTLNGDTGYQQGHTGGQTNCDILDSRGPGNLPSVGVHSTTGAAGFGRSLGTSAASNWLQRSARYQPSSRSFGGNRSGSGTLPGTSGVSKQQLGTWFRSHRSRNHTGDNPPAMLNVVSDLSNLAGRPDVGGRRGARLRALDLQSHGIGLAGLIGPTSGWRRSLRSRDDRESISRVRGTTRPFTSG